MRKRTAVGFTLVELLVVIAIIGILASIVAVALPRAIEYAKIARMTGHFNDLRTTMTAYYAAQSTYPPRYGYRADFTIGQLSGGRDGNSFFIIDNYLSTLGIYNQDSYDEFALSYSTSIPPTDSLNLLEFSPILEQIVTDFDFSPDVKANLYDPFRGNTLGNRVNQQLAEDGRPYVYVPVNKNQFQRAEQYWLGSQDYLATTWDTTSAVGRRSIGLLNFPPPRYDAYVMISPGPGGGTFGLLDDPPFINQIPLEDRYHIAALRTYFLATRDLNNNNEFDFHFESRARQSEADAEYTVNSRNPATNVQEVVDPATAPLVTSFFSGNQLGDQFRIFPNSLPDLERPNGYGPYIYVVE